MWAYGMVGTASCRMPIALLTAGPADTIDCLSSAVSVDQGSGQAIVVGPDAFVPAHATPARDATAVRGTGARAVAAQAARTRWWIEGLVIVWLCWVYDMTTNLAPLRLHLALAHAEGILALERSLGIAPELSMDRWLAHHRTLGLVVSDYYDNAHFIVTLGLLGWVWWRRADIYRPLRNTLVLANVIAFVVFWLYPVAPPRMLTHDGFSDIVASTGAIGSWHTGALASAANQLAAMPSLHMAWAGWCALVVWRLTDRVWLRGLGLLYPCMTAFAVLATGNHYVLDVLAGLLTLGLAMALVAGIPRVPRLIHGD